MIDHYLRATWARIARTPFVSAANVVTLGLGLACFIAVWGIAQWWQFADAYHAGAERIVVIGQRNTILGAGSGQGETTRVAPLNAISSWNLATHLGAEFPEIEQVARLNALGASPVVAGSRKAMMHTAVADPALLQILDFQFVSGDPARALAEPNSAVITESAATRLFGNGQALGQSLLVDGTDNVTITGVIRAIRQPSFIGERTDAVARFELLRHWGSSTNGRQLDGLPAWIGIAPWTLVRLPPSLSIEGFNARLPAFVERRAPASSRQMARIELQAFPVRHLSTFELNSAFFGGGASISVVAAILGLGLLTLLVACINYANLTAAQTAARSREFGLRKALGARRTQILFQTWVEAVVLASAGLLLALGILSLAAPAVRSATGIDMLYFLSDSTLPVLYLIVLVIVVAVVGGAWPAWLLAALRPVIALRSGRGRGGSRVIARILVGVQFASASFLLILLMVTQLQRAHLERSALALHTDPIVVLNDIARVDVDYDTLATRLAAVPGVRGITVVDHAPWSESYTGTALASSPDAAANPVNAFFKSVGYDYFETLDLKLLAGRTFDRSRDTTSVSLYAFSNSVSRALPVILDRRLAESLGIAAEPASIGKLIYVPARLNAQGAQPLEIIGITETEWSRLGANTGDGHIYTFSPRALFGGQWPLVKIARDDVAGTVKRVSGVWDELVPAAPADVRFFDSLFEQSFQSYARISRIFALLAGTAFVIASVGLLGFAVHAVARRRREIGVRKTLGASAMRVLRLMLWDFSKPVLVANVLAWPLAFVAAQAYLKAFADRTPLTPLPFLISLGVTLVIAWSTVAGQAYRAARLRPATVLRTE